MTSCFPSHLQLISTRCHVEGCSLVAVLYLVTLLRRRYETTEALKRRSKFCVSCQALAFYCLYYSFASQLVDFLFAVSQLTQHIIGMFAK